jgi:hypothetical protein
MGMLELLSSTRLGDSYGHDLLNHEVYEDLYDGFLYYAEVTQYAHLRSIW